MSKFKRFTRENGWIWAALGAVLLWLVMGIYSGRLNLESFLSNAYIASFLAILAFGQMLVVTSGRGAIDLSIPGVVTLSAFVTMATVNGSNAKVIVALILIIIIGAVIGFLNSMLTIYVQIPAMIGTMAMNYILTTVALLFNKRFSTFKTAPILDSFSKLRIFGVQGMIYIAIIVTVILWFVMNKTPFGKSLSALGQNREAAKFAGINVLKVEILTYIISSILAALGGFFIAARAGNAILGMGDSYTMETVASVVVGGTLMSGGKANVIGTLAGCLFLNLVVTSMQIMGFGSGAQNIAKGLLIIIVFILGIGDVRAKA